VLCRPRYARPAVRSQPTWKGEPNGGFLFKLETPHGTPADPAEISSTVPNWSPGDTIPLGRRTLQVLEVRDDDADQPPVLVVEDLAQ
jgi:hypothetical protein